MRLATVRSLRAAAQVTASLDQHIAIGERLGIGAERSRQVERDALRRLRSIAATAGLGTEAA